MKTFPIPHTNLKASRIAYGCGSIGGSWDETPRTDSVRAKALAVLKASFDCGINFYDHADIYTYGKSEAVFAEVVRELGHKRDQFILQSKVGIRFKGDPTPNAVGRYDFSYERIVSGVDGSLKRLGTDHLDILLLHRPDALMEPEEIARAFDVVQKSGKVRHFGVSNHNGAQLELLRKYVKQPFVANQLQFSLVHTGLIDAGISVNQAKPSVGCEGILDYCRLHDIAIQAWSPMTNGRAIGKWTAGKPDDELARVVAEYAAGKKVPADAIALAWLMRHPARVQPIIGTMNPERVAASSQADAVELTREEWYRLYTAARGQGVP